MTPGRSVVIGATYQSVQNDAFTVVIRVLDTEMIGLVGIVIAPLIEMRR
jgi:hypothetical protein